MLISQGRTKELNMTFFPLILVFSLQDASRYIVKTLFKQTQRYSPEACWRTKAGMKVQEKRIFPHVIFQC